MLGRGNLPRPTVSVQDRQWKPVERDAAVRTRRHLDYREANDWALDAGVLVDAMEAEAERNPSRELLKLIELSVGRVARVILKSDDSSGMMGDVAHRLLAIHEQVALAGVAEPKALARWMIKFGFDDQDFFTIDPVRYAPALGDKGMALYRDAVAERSSQGRARFAVKHATERLAVLVGDIEAIVVAAWPRPDFSSSVHPCGGVDAGVGAAR